MDSTRTPSSDALRDCLLAPVPVLDVATLSSGLGDTAARESVARLLARPALRSA